MMNIESCMTPRLRAVAGCVRGGGRVADIGTDHAYIPIYLAEKGMISGALAMDIHVGPICRAEENIRKYHLETVIDTRLSDGLQKLAPDEADEIIIAGMGGILISEIIDARRDLWSDNIRFVLQPMTASEELRKYLEKNGFCIEEEALAEEENKIYQIICAARGGMKMQREADYYIGPYLRQYQIPLTAKLIEHRIREFEKMLPGLLRSGRDEAKAKLEYVQALLEELYSLQRECAKW